MGCKLGGVNGTSGLKITILPPPLPTESKVERSVRCQARS